MSWVAFLIGSEQDLYRVLIAHHLLLSFSSTFLARAADVVGLREDSFGPRSSSKRCVGLCGAVIEGSVFGPVGGELCPRTREKLVMKAL